VAVAAEGLQLREGPQGVTLRVRVIPRSARDAIGGERDGALVVRLTAPPVEGAANDALVRALGRALGVAPSAVRVVSGERSRTKVVAVAGVDAAAVLRRLAPGAAAVRSGR
jgi:uncharacterized protein (TIGR00251 family)